MCDRQDAGIEEYLRSSELIGYQILDITIGIWHVKFDCGFAHHYKLGLND